MHVVLWTHNAVATVVRLQRFAESFIASIPRLTIARQVVAAFKATVQLETAVVPFHARHRDGAVVIADMSPRWAAIAARK